MIYTVTFNPSLDYIVSVDNFTVGIVNRTVDEVLFPGGKGINVSIVLQNLGVKSIALGFAAGFTGEEICKRLHAMGCQEEFIMIEKGWSRINLKLRSTEESEINGQGPRIGEDNIQALYDKLDILKEGDVLVLAGSIPNTMPDDMYRVIMERLEGKGVQVVIDATRELLVKTLTYGPFLVKPNNHELGEIFDVEIHTQEDVIIYGKKLQEMGARNVLVSMAGDGAVFVGEDGQIYQSPAPAGKVVNSVGAGDSMVAGFLAGYLEKQDFQYAFFQGVSAGSASAFSENLATREEVDEILKTLI